MEIVKNNKIGVLIIGINGAVATTAIAGVFALVKGLVNQTCLLTEDESMVPLQFMGLDRLCFGGWDICQEDMYQATLMNGVIKREIVEEIRRELEEINIFHGTAKDCGKGIRQLIDSELTVDKLDRRYIVETIQNDIKNFKKSAGVSEVIIVNLASTSPKVQLDELHFSLDAFEIGLNNNDYGIKHDMLYAYSAIMTGCPYINFTPSVSIEIPALTELAEKKGLPIAGKDGKTGQTLYKTVIAPMLKRRQLKLTGWYSTNILGNKDGLVLNEPANSATKIFTKERVLQDILGYTDFVHKVRIDYYPPRGDKKEAWDNIDFTGWLDKPMCMKIDWLGEDSILAAPLVIDLVRLIEYAHRNGEKGVMSHLSMFFKSPCGTKEHDFFKQCEMLDEYIESHKARILSLNTKNKEDLTHEI